MVGQLVVEMAAVTGATGATTGTGTVRTTKRRKKKRRKHDSPRKRKKKRRQKLPLPMTSAGPRKAVAATTRGLDSQVSAKRKRER